MVLCNHVPPLKKGLTASHAAGGWDCFWAILRAHEEGAQVGVCLRPEMS
jgi:hypothetical protein